MLGWIWKLLPQSRYIRACNTTHSFLDHYINQALREAKVSADGAFNDERGVAKTKSLLQALSSQTNDRISIRSEILQSMMASQETTSALLANACLLLSRHPIYWEKTRTEISGTGNDGFEYDDVLKFKTIQNILLETLRLYPVFPLMARAALRDTTLPVGVDHEAQTRGMSIVSTLRLGS
jgi:cytochrome P450